MHLLEIYLFGPSLKLSISLLLSIIFSRFSWFSRNHLIFCTFFRRAYYPASQDYICILLSIQVIGRFFRLVLLSFSMCCNFSMYKVILQCLWILCSILSDSLGIIGDFLASSKFLPLFVRLIFSISSVDRLWVRSCLRWFPWGILLDHCGLSFGHPFDRYASCKHLFISTASLSWTLVNFLNQNPYIPSWSGVL